MMTLRKGAGLAAITLLVVLNAWRWWPSTQVSSEKAGAATAMFHLEDFDIDSFPVSSMEPLSRDIFHPEVAVDPPPVIEATPQDALPVKSPEELAYEAALAEFAQIRCVGVSVRDNRFQAFIFSQGAHFLVSSGDKVGSRFVVDKIVSNGVVLHDPDTEVGGEVAVSGK